MRLMAVMVYHEREIMGLGHRDIGTTGWLLWMWSYMDIGVEALSLLNRMNVE